MKIKRILDILLVLILLVPAAIFSLIICLIIYLQTKQSPFFIQERGLSLSLYRFKIYKFRTMVSEGVLTTDNSLLKRDIKKYTVSRFGEFLRKTGLDELPQLINILKGEMSFVGPRPLDLRDLINIKDNYTNFYFERDKLNIKPGLTGYWQITRGEIRSINYLIKADAYYHQNQSISLDLKIIFNTALLLLLFKDEKNFTLFNKYINNSSFNIEKV